MNKKIRMFQALLIVTILLLQMIIPIVPSIAAGETITIECKDKNFYNAIKKELGDKVKTSDDNGLKLTALKSDVEGISELYLYQDYNAEDTIKIKDISGIENFKGLTTLDLSCNQISDISAIAGLTNLKNLNLGRNQISDISKISGLTNLIFLDLNFNKISDISKISGLTKLTTLCLSGNEISDISKISGVTKLTNLRLGGNEISDISAISGLTKLTSLDLGGNE
ncbi:MAG: leucine-rich repeat domain-containing protein, partial [Clostridia bacterium]|nr:leucine-rich repeat domain-containing protein [Clostridia bacterium]